jgi:phage tail-like protein
MADSAIYQKASYPLTTYNFRVKVDETLMNFTEVSGIAVEYDHVTYRHGLSFWEGESIETFYYNRFIPITCKRGTIYGNKPTFLYDWLQKRDLRSMEISLCDEQSNPMLSWKIAYAVPTSLKAPAFSAASNDVSIETLELQGRGVSFKKVMQAIKLTGV